MCQNGTAIRLSYGEVITDILGSDRNHEDEGDELDDDDDTDDDDADDADDSDDDDSDDDDSSDSKPKRKTRVQLEQDLASVTRERDQLVRRRTRVDRARVKAENELAALKAGGAKELADAQAEVERLTAELAAKTGTDTTTLIREEFRDSDKYDWHNRKTAFGLLDLSEIDVDDDGNVDEDSLNDAIEKLATDHPYLVKKVESTDDTDDDDEDDEKEKPAPRSGAPMNGRKRSPREKSRAQVADKFPIVKGRIPIN